MEQIEQSGQPGREVVLGAMALWVAAHGDFELPARESAEPEPAEAVTIPNTDESLVDEELLPVSTSTEIARVAFDDIARRQDVSVVPTSPEGIENVVALKQAFTDLFAPYVAGVNAHIQHAKKLPRWKSEGVDTWQAVQTLRGLPTNVFFSARYTSHDKYNEALGLEVAYSRRSKPHKRDLHISLDFKDGGVEKLTIKTAKDRSTAAEFIECGYKPPYLLRRLIESSPSEKSVFPPENKCEWYMIGHMMDYGLGWTHIFYFQEEVPHIISGTDWIKINRLFNAEANAFRSELQCKDEVLPTVSEYTINPEQVLNFVDALMAALPREDRTENPIALQ